MALTKEQSLRQAIDRENAMLADLARKHNESRERLTALKAKLATMESMPVIPSAPAIQPNTDIPTTAERKISLFRKLFRGRDDVFPLLWVSSKTGRKGYSPACGNEWVRGVCGKPRVKCSECPNQAFLPLDNQVFLDHLQGRHTIGVYPLLKDETCWFLAADFDKESWLDDVAAFVDTHRSSCRACTTPVCGQDRSVITPAEPDHATGSLSKSGVLQKAKHAVVNGIDTTGNQLC